MSALATGVLRADDNWDETDGAKIYDSIGEIIADDGSAGGEYSQKLNAANARRLVACWNACDGVPLEWLESGLSGCVQGLREDRDEWSEEAKSLKAQRDNLSTALGTSTANYATLAAKLAQAESQRDALLKATRRLADAAFARDTTMGDPCGLMAAQAELRDATKQALDAIANTTRTPS